MAEPSGVAAASREVIPAGHAAPSPETEAGGPPPRTGVAALSVAALGVVFGDIGTSPVYTLKECFDPEHGLPLSPENVLGVLSLIVWALILVVACKYVSLMMRADNHGEGGILALLALAQDAVQSSRALNIVPSSRSAVPRCFTATA